ncbi:hypothetical protein FIBSPDRAFT_884747 [Athelia psychrophila]|uniref:Uncharacterized protein n=1 Tax=Athelia psychrophila TaxID=1759441 RepID=A0A166SQV9_9AGAM|nr:hypothetical protein FIBSPDRAFT_884747 [Fibularhizoctonia sp. CBS 109695]
MPTTSTNVSCVRAGDRAWGWGRPWGLGVRMGLGIEIEHGRVGLAWELAGWGVGVRAGHVCGRAWGICGYMRDVCGLGARVRAGTASGRDDRETTVKQSADLYGTAVNPRRFDSENGA